MDNLPTYVIDPTTSRARQLCRRCFGVKADSTDNVILGELRNRCRCPTDNTVTVGSPLPVRMPARNRKDRRSARHRVKVVPKGYR